MRVVGGGIPMYPGRAVMSEQNGKGEVGGYVHERRSAAI